ncbi:MAG: hypothetical protein IKR34_02660 [Candidatus Gastranaerophilales bacterium]|nr:hypothetical protein [Candidatus Gastranaerophilales bacterium]
MTIIRKIVLEANDDMIDEIIEELQNECDYWARNLLEKAGLDDLEWDEYVEYKDKLAKEIFDDVMTRLNFDSKAE